MFRRRTSLGIQLVGFGTAALVFIADQLSKLWVLQGLNLDDPASGGRIEVLPFFDLTMVWNVGISFGLFPASTLLLRIIFIVFSVAVSLYLGSWIWRAERRLRAIACGIRQGGELVGDQAFAGCDATQAFIFRGFSTLRMPGFPSES